MCTVFSLANNRRCPPIFSHAFAYIAQFGGDGTSSKQCHKKNEQGKEGVVMPEYRKITEREVSEFLDKFKMPHSSIGFQYLVKAIIIGCNDVEIREARKVMALYEKAAAAYNTTSARVERAIRSMLRRISCGKTNGQFIYWAVDNLMIGTCQDEAS